MLAGIRLPWQQLWQQQCELLTHCETAHHWAIAQKFSQVTMQYLAPFEPSATICPGTVSLFVFLWLVADALQANLSSLTFALLFNHNQPIMHSEIQRQDTFQLWGLTYMLFAVGFVTNQTVFWGETQYTQLQELTTAKSCVHPLTQKLASLIRIVNCLSLH